MYKSLQRWRILPQKWITAAGINQCARAGYSKKSVLLAHTVFEPPKGMASESDGVPLLMTHGLLGSKQNWNSIAKATARTTGRMVVAFDARNHGDSPHTTEITYHLMAEDILRLTKHLKFRQFMLLGHSMGGRSVMTFALKYPEMLERIIVVDVSPLEQSADFPSMIVFVHTLRELEIRLEGNKDALSKVRSMADDVLKGVTLDPAVRAFLLTNLAVKDGKIYWKPNLKALLEHFGEIGSFPAELLERNFSKPTLFIRGQKSLYIPLSDFANIQKTFTNAQLATVENAGHWPHAENTVRFMEIMLPFLSGHVVAD